MRNFVKIEIMIKNVLSIFILTLIIACNPLKHTGNDNSSMVKIQINDVSKIGESILFEIENIASQPIIIFNPERLWIERLEGDKWKKLKIPECLCDAPCQASTETFELKSGNRIKQVWDQKESWCGPRTKGQIRETIFKAVDKGWYRITIRFKTITGEESSFYQEFQITD